MPWYFSVWDTQLDLIHLLDFTVPTILCDLYRPQSSSLCGSRYSSDVYCWVTGMAVGGSSPCKGWEFFSSPPCPNRLWVPPSLLSNGYQGLLPGGKVARAWNWISTSSAEFKDVRSYTLTPPIRLHDVVLSRSTETLYVFIYFKRWRFPCALTEHYATKAYWRSGGTLHVFLTSALDRAEWSASHPCRVNPRERAPGGTNWRVGWVGLRAGLDPVVNKKIPSPCRDSNSRSSSRSPTLYRWDIPAFIADLWPTLMGFSIYI
jgi:hypothetical protein